MKVIIPVAGAGVELRPHSYTQPKALIPLAGNTVLGIILDQLLKEGITDYVFIVGYLGDKICNYVTEKYPKINAHFVTQENRKGVGHAVSLAKEIVGDDEVLVVLGDTICEYDIRSVIESPESLIGVRKTDNPRDFGVVEINGDTIEWVVEKPKIPKSNMAMVGIYKIKESRLLFECLEQNMQEGVLTRGQVTITDAIDCMIKKGVKFEAFKVDNWFDAGNKDSLLASNAILIKKFGQKINTNQYEDSVIIDPVSIGDGCVIKNSIIGPNVTLGENTLIERSIVNNSIIGAFTTLSDIVLTDSLIGGDTLLKGKKRILNVGENTTIDLG
ncbi:MAG: sugar phosphate nucleotidyltransferase [Niabella sp.]